MIKQSQSGIEFLVISIAVLFFFTIFFLAIQSSTSEREKEKDNLVIKNLALSIQDEINLAAEASEGYNREFQVPEKILGRNYDISIVDEHIYIKTSMNTISLKIDEVEGEIKKGKNIIRKENDKLYLNS